MGAYQMKIAVPSRIYSAMLALARVARRQDWCARLMEIAVKASVTMVCVSNASPMEQLAIQTTFLAIAVKDLGVTLMP